VVRRIGVFPSSARRRRQALFAGLELAFPVRFVGLDDESAADVDAVVLFPPGRPGRIPRVKAFAIQQDERSGLPALVRFGSAPSLDPRLHGKNLRDEAAPDSIAEVGSDDEVFAAVDRNAVWIRRRSSSAPCDVVAQGPSELAENEVLRDHLTAGRFIALLPLIHFLREVVAGIEWSPPELRAAFIIDDPNLHWRSYGYLDYAEVAECAQAFGFHLAVAGVPLDWWYANRQAVRIFRSNRDRLSIAIHGNEHAKHELKSFGTQEEAVASLAQALQRAKALERKTGLQVTPVMIPPHEACSSRAMRAMATLGYEAVCLTRPYSWVEGERGEEYGHPFETRTLAGWEPAELSEPQHPPVIVRRELGNSGDAVLRGFLGQPIVHYCHVWDLANGLDRLSGAATEINSLGAVRWCNLQELSRTNFKTRRKGSRLEVQPYARVVDVGVLDAEEVCVFPPVPLAQTPYDVQLQDEGANWTVLEDIVGVASIPLPSLDVRELRITFGPLGSVRPTDVPVRRAGGRAIARRAMSELRDRASPLVLHSRRTR
jgi:hypothetical protein